MTVATQQDRYQLGQTLKHFAMGQTVVFPLRDDETPRIGLSRINSNIRMWDTGGAKFSCRTVGGGILVTKVGYWPLSPLSIVGRFEAIADLGCTSERLLAADHAAEIFSIW